MSKDRTPYTPKEVRGIIDTIDKAVRRGIPLDQVLHPRKEARDELAELEENLLFIFLPRRIPRDLESQAVTFLDFFDTSRQIIKSPIMAHLTLEGLARRAKLLRMAAENRLTAEIYPHRAVVRLEDFLNWRTIEQITTRALEINRKRETV